MSEARQGLSWECIKGHKFPDNGRDPEKCSICETPLVREIWKK